MTSSNPTPTTTYRTVSVDGLKVFYREAGDPKAPVVLTEFADLQCPFCRDYALNVLPQIIERYVRTGRLRLELRLRAFLGADSDVAGRAAQAAATRDRMWNFVDLFYRNQGTENTGYVTDAEPGPEVASVPDAAVSVACIVAMLTLLSSCPGATIASSAAAFQESPMPSRQAQQDQRLAPAV